MVGTSIGPYRILRELDPDRVGRVFEAIDITRKKNVLIKTLRPEIANHPEVLARLYSKAETLALLNHEYIARLFGFVRRADGLHLVMESVEGKNLHDFLQEKGRLDLALALAFFRQILLAVEFAHRLGVVHGELNPTNIILTDFARIKVLDFAIATILGSPVPADTADATKYMSPEQIRGEPADVRSDIYSLGILLHELLVGRTPFECDTADGSANVRAELKPRPPSSLVAGIPQWLDSFLLRAIAPSPAHRFQSILAMSNTIGVALEAEARKASPKHHGFGRRRIERSSSFAVITPGLKALLANTAKETQQKDNGPRRNFDSPHSKQLMSSLRNKIRQISAPLKAVPSKANLALAIGFALNKMGAGIRQGAAAIDPAPLIRYLGGELRNWIHSQGESLKAIRPGFQGAIVRSREFVRSVSENGWKRYVIIAILLASVMIETFIFGGANTLLNRDFNSPIPEIGKSATEDVVRQDASATATATPIAEPEPKPEPAVADRINKKPRSLDKQNSELFHQALNIKRTVTYRIPRAEAENQPSAQESRVAEPMRRNPESNPTKTQLNVKWEN